MNQKNSTLLEEILQGNRRSMAKAITLLESTNPESFEKGQKLLDSLLPYTGKALRIGITGVPGVGKSTFIEAFGKLAHCCGKKDRRKDVATTNV